MNEELFQRTAFLIGQDRIQSLHQKHVCVFGVGGVGDHAIDVLARSGIGEISIVDHDHVTLNNINRQYVATTNTINHLKVEVMKEHLLAINPDIKVHTYPMLYLPENADELPLDHFDYIIDAIDTISAKVELIIRAKEKKIPIISAMGCGNRMDPSKVQINDLFQVTHDPLAKIIRHELRKRKIISLPVVHSVEPPIKPTYFKEIFNLNKKPPGSSPFVPAVAGITLAYFVVSELINKM